MVDNMRILVTAGPTREYIDPVRFISNRSSGKMGFAIAGAARQAGHDVRLISGPVTIDAPVGVDYISIVSADDMLHEVQNNIDWCDVLIMSAAVADWKPERISNSKLKKSDMSDCLKLVRTPDILNTIKQKKGDRIFVGFAAESGAPEKEAARKLREKGLDLIVANDISRADAGFAVDTNCVTLLFANGDKKEWPLMSKDEIGRRLVAEIGMIK